ncbi:mucin-2-like [Haliotis rubra]|uniref:mucin-2-like n=1 Tax=Haliotis rubra TaxID=36100 RepID=UPI001EE5C70F|nr:mucin-2-like [Haliotis rubra]
MALTTSSVILFQFIVVFCYGMNPTTILNLGGSYDKILQGHGYELLKVKTLEHCHRICLYSPKCLSVNWNIKTKYCQLNSEDSGTGTLMMSTGDVYVPALSSNIKNHACILSPCKFGEVCIPVTSAADFVCLLPGDQVSTTTQYSTPTTMPTTPIPTTTPTTTLTAPMTTTPTTTTPTTTPTTTTPAMTSTKTTPTTTMTTTTPTTTTPSTTTPTTTMTTTTPTTTTTTTTTTPTTTTTTTTTTRDCSTYSSSFTRIQGYVVWLLNNRSIYSVSSVSTCQQYCVQNTPFTCKSYEYYYGKQWCFLQSFVKDDALSEWRKDSRGDYFERLRQCDISV